MTNLQKKQGQNDKPLHEINQYNDTAFPVGMYIVTKNRIIPEGRGYLDLHWHEELQFTMVTNGVLKIRVNGELYELKEGEAIFINRNLLHITTALTDDGRYVSFNFPDKLLGFFPGSRMEQDDVLPFTSNPAFPATVLKAGVEWQDIILKELWELERLFLRKDRQRTEYLTALKLTYIWYTLISNIGDKIPIPSKSYVRKQERIQCMISYIHDNYMNNIRLYDIASAASVSEGECCRCFQEMVRESPSQYLLGYRISRSMELLNTTELSVTEIALRCGFNDVSHFIQYFKKKTGMTPKGYRHKKC